MHLGQTGPAVQSLTAALSLDPSLTFVREHLERLAGTVPPLEK